MMKIMLSVILATALIACQPRNRKPVITDYPPQKPPQTSPGSKKAPTTSDLRNSYEANPILEAEKKAGPQGLKILKTGRRMTLIDKERLPGSCWDYANAVYNRAGYPPEKRKIVFKSSRSYGPYANTSLVQPGDWLYYINHWYGEVEHSAIFVAWIDYDNKEGLMLSYGGENRREPARYRPYDLSHIYYIIRPKKQ